MCNLVGYQGDDSKALVEAKKQNRVVRLPFRPAGREGLGESGEKQPSYRSLRKKKC